MTERKNFEMTQGDLDEILQACKSVPLIALQCGMPASPQEKANAAWGRLGDRMGFEEMTVEPNRRSGDRFFSAIPKPVVINIEMTEEEAEEERQAHGQFG